MHDGRSQIECGAALERTLARHHLNEHDAQRPDIRARIRRRAENDFWRHIGQGAGDDPERFERRDRLRRFFWQPLCGATGDPEIEHLDHAVACHHRVDTLQVAMDDTTLVSVHECRCNLRGVAHGGIYRQPVPANRVRERLALDKLHHQKDVAIDLVHFVHDADVRM